MFGFLFDMFKFLASQWWLWLIVLLFWGVHQII